MIQARRSTTGSPHPPAPAPPVGSSGRGPSRAFFLKRRRPSAAAEAQEATNDSRIEEVSVSVGQGEVPDHPPAGPAGVELPHELGIRSVTTFVVDDAPDLRLGDHIRPAARSAGADYLDRATAHGVPVAAELRDIDHSAELVHLPTGHP